MYIDKNCEDIYIKYTVIENTARMHKIRNLHLHHPYSITSKLLFITFSKYTKSSNSIVKLIPYPTSEF